MGATIFFEWDFNPTTPSDLIAVFIITFPVFDVNIYSKKAHPKGDTP